MLVYYLRTCKNLCWVFSVFLDGSRLAESLDDGNFTVKYNMLGLSNCML